MDPTGRFIEEVEKGNVIRALALAMDRAAMAPDDLNAKACLGLAYALTEQWSFVHPLVKEVLDKDPDHEIALAAKLLAVFPQGLEKSPELTGPDGFKLTSKWFMRFARAHVWDGVDKMGFIMVRDASPKVRADFLENVAPWFHDRAREAEEKGEPGEKIVSPAREEKP